MAKFIPFEKRSKKEQRALNAKKTRHLVRAEPGHPKAAQLQSIQPQ